MYFEEMRGNVHGSVLSTTSFQFVCYPSSKSLGHFNHNGHQKLRVPCDLVAQDAASYENSSPLIVCPVVIDCLETYELCRGKTSGMNTKMSISVALERSKMIRAIRTHDPETLL